MTSTPQENIFYIKISVFFLVVKWVEKIEL